MYMLTFRKYRTITPINRMNININIQMIDLKD